MGEKMVLRRTPYLLLTLFVVASAQALHADECTSSSASSIHISANSYRNMTGHWIVQASLTRIMSRVGSDVRNEERPWHYEFDITRPSCSDEDTMTLTFNVIAPPTYVSLGVPRTALPARAAAHAGYTFFPDVGFYKLHMEPMIWEDARRACEEEGAHLAIVNSEAEEKAIIHLMKVVEKEHFRAHIGFHDKDTEGQYVTIFGQPLSSTGRVNWAKGEPNNVNRDGSEDEDCGEIYYDGTINDVHCSSMQAFMCELPV